jgi:hypothetical protein
MPNIITSANFVGDIMLPNVTGTSASATQLTTFITKYEEEYLKRILGYDLYVLYVAGIAALDQDYEDIRDGSTYTGDDDLTYEWKGLAGVGESPIANYVYYRIMDYNVSQTQGVGGESMSANENGTHAASKAKMVAAWNQMVEWNFDLHRFLYENRATYPDYYGLTYSPFNTAWYSSPPINYDLFTKINVFCI